LGIEREWNQKKNQKFHICKIALPWIKTEGFIKTMQKTPATINTFSVL
jgi:hypothetical protein